MTFNPKFTITNQVAAALTKIERARGFLEAAKAESTKAHMLADSVGVEDWNKAYPGNDPAAGQAGLNHFKAAIERNIR
jgi:hypothetical protein